MRCEGWWEQDHFGRQPMRGLKLRFTNGEIRGEGVDIVGPFQFSGDMDQGRVRMVKKYFGRHQVAYHGQYDGEGTIQGSWQVGVLVGNWAIKIGPAAAASAEISEWQTQLRTFHGC